MDLQFLVFDVRFVSLQNSPYFCVVKYARTVNERSGVRLKTESETGAEKLKIPYFSLGACGTLTPHRGVVL